MKCYEKLDKIGKNQKTQVRVPRVDRVNSYFLVFFPFEILNYHLQLCSYKKLLNFLLPKWGKMLQFHARSAYGSQNVDWKFIMWVVNINFTGEV